MTQVTPHTNPEGQPLRPHETYVHGHHWRSRHDEADGAKLGMWLFLSTELLLFAGFFCAYAAFRMMYPGNWQAASDYYLDANIGLINTCVLLLSSWTVVMAIRSTQLDRKWPAFIYLGITNLCAIFFLVTKITLEYIPKINKGKLPGRFFNYPPGGGAADTEAVKLQTLPEALGPQVDAGRELGTALQGAADQVAAGVMTHAPGVVDILPIAADAAHGAGEHYTPQPHDHIFLSIYWISTSTHGIHVLVGVILLTWLMVRNLKNHFGPRNYMSVENVGLYWHIVDLIWIFLFPLLYLA